MSTRYSTEGQKRWQAYLLRFLIILVSTVVIVLAMPKKSVPNYEVKENSVWLKEPVTAGIDFDVPKDSITYQAQVDSAMQYFVPYYEINDEIGNRYIKRFQSKYRNGIEGLPKSFVNSVTAKLREIYNVGIMPSEDYAKITRDTLAVINFKRGNTTRKILCTEFYTPLKAYESFFKDPQMNYARNMLQKCNIDYYLKENLFYDNAQCQADIENLTSTITKHEAEFKKGECIVDRGQVATPIIVKALATYSAEMEKNESLMSRSTTMTGRALIIIMLLSVFTIYLHLFRGDYFRKPRSLAMVYFLIVLFPVLVSLTYQYSQHYIYILPLAMLPMFIRIFLDSRTAFIAHITMVLIAALALSQPFIFVIVQVVSGLVSIFSLRELSKRSQVFTASVTTCAAGLIVYQALKLTQPGEDWHLSPGEVSHFIFCGVLLLTSYPLMYVVEKAFGFTSAVTLFELSDINKDLLRRLSEVSAGTMQHSITVSNIAADIAQKIGARSLLVRTGALYHDIGKISNPSFFTENQKDINPHDHMTPQESARIIINHVKEGKRLAEKYGLPNEIIDFIMTHHGAGMTKYFYITYKNAHPDEEVDKAPFTYPGPNPFTTEQAILMMADSVEAASRSLKDYTEESITELVNRVIDGIVADGFFLDCPITFHDISVAKRVIIERLKTNYHTRITYPELKTAAQKSAEQEAKKMKKK